VAPRLSRETFLFVGVWWCVHLFLEAKETEKQNKDAKYNFVLNAM